LRPHSARLMSFTLLGRAKLMFDLVIVDIDFCFGSEGKNIA
jgi:hypothetical protein